MYQCPNCGSNLHFDIRSQKLLCDACMSTFDPDAFDTGSGAEEDDTFGVTVFTCSQCGAELLSTDESATGFCSYCGASTVLSSRLSSETRPKYITPFKKTKEDCQKAYLDVLKKSVYAPKDLKDPAFLERFRGIYMPYWLYRIHFNPSLTLPAVKTEHSGSYTYTKEYNLTCRLGGVYENIPYDASSSFDDSISSTIAPFSAKEMKPFSPAYLAGFYADTADVDKVVYRQDAMDQAGKYAMRRIDSQMSAGGYQLTKPSSSEEIEAALGTKCDYPEGAFLPVWFLTWRKKDRVAYAIVNGETGKVAADVPVDLGKYFLGTALLAVLLFVIANLLLTVTASKTLLLGALFAFAAQLLFYFELREIMRKENHIKDKGFFARGGTDRSRSLTEKEQNRQRKAGSSKAEKAKGRASSVVFVVFLFLAMGGASVLFALISVIGQLLLSFGLFLITAVSLYVFIRSLMLMRDVSEKSMILPAAASFIAVVWAFLVTRYKPVEDWHYYAATILCLAGVFITCVELIRRHNLLATRPVPNLFNREGGNDRFEKDRPAGNGDTGLSGAGGTSAGILALFLTGTVLFSLFSGVRVSAQSDASGPAGAAVSVSYYDADTPGYINPDTGYQVYLCDGADLLSDEEELALFNDMAPVTSYGGAAFVSLDYNYRDTDDAAKDYFRKYFGTDSGTLFMIDMDNRNIYIFSDGAIYRTVSKAYANTITDNVYRSASRGDYYACASEAFSQITTLLDGGRISQPMKYTTNALLALILSLLINYGFVKWTARSIRPTTAQLLGAITVGFTAGSRQLQHIRTTRRFTGSSSGGGGGGGGGFSGGGGGGGSSGGGGGHSF